jgi:hypothetical protein
MEKQTTKTNEVQKSENHVVSSVHILHTHGKISVETFIGGGEDLTSKETLYDDISNLRVACYKGGEQIFNTSYSFDYIENNSEFTARYYRNYVVRSVVREGKFNSTLLVVLEMI